MKLYEAWEKTQEMCKTQEEQSALWEQYYSTETEAYKRILTAKEFLLKGTAKELAEKLGLEPVIFAPFADGINTSLETPVDYQSMEEETEIELHILPEKLYYNMMNAKAKWLYSLPEWEDVLSEDKRNEIIRQWREDHQAVSQKVVGRNDPCPCGSGKKYKNCCGKA